ncbi:hypothetical protein [Halobacterium rubrum]|uniref:hypothetical protein n=1 Tax=Halobacterium TaxID=2239 RepID=UPI001F466AAC|nr:MULTISPECIES: hypothetical protein [Halobacterium]MDH5020366.1 hypothetical protein [Halobacterium rubrum]
MAGEPPEFVWRKFTITETLDAVLQEMAASHYQGNVSLCLRAAIESHQAMLRGEGQLAAQQVVRRLDAIDDRQARLTSQLEDFATDDSGVDYGGTISAAGVELSGEIAEIYTVLAAQSGALRIDDLVEKLDVELEELHAGLTRLVDLGIVTATGDTPSRYCLAGSQRRSGGGGLR